MNRRESVRARMAKPKKTVSLGASEYFSFFLTLREKAFRKCGNRDRFPVICAKPTTGKSMIQVWKQSRVLEKRKTRLSENREPCWGKG
jgi:hypothetical protein